MNPSTFAVVLVEPETPGNIGTVARAMKNFGAERLLLVDPPPLDPDGEAYGFAGQARGDVLENRQTVTLESVCREFHTIGFTATAGANSSEHVRYPAMSIEALREVLADRQGPVAFVFGRERIGLTNRELARMDRVCTIRANPAYPTLNLGQAATIALYRISDLLLDADQLPDASRDSAEPVELEHLYARMGRVLGAVDYPAEKQPKTERMLRRLLGRADPTAREVRTAHGILRRIERRLEQDRQVEAETATALESARSGGDPDSDTD